MIVRTINTVENLLSSMEFTYTEEQHELLDATNRIVEQEISPTAQERYWSNEYPEAILESLGAEKIPGVTIPEAYGGLGYGPVEYALVSIELGAALMPLASALSVHGRAANLIARYGTERQKQRYLADMATFQTVGSHGVTEERAGNDSSQIETTAVSNGDTWVVTGHKQWVTNFKNADIMTLFAQTQAEDGTENGVTIFLVPTEELTLEKQWNTLGLHGVKPCKVRIEAVEVSDEDVVGEVGEGLAHLSKLYTGAVSYAARGVGIARAALEDSITYSTQRHQFDQRISDFQGIQWKLADMAIRTNAAQLLTLQAAASVAQDTPGRGTQVSMAKVFAGEAACKNAAEAMQIHGGVGYTAEYTPTRYLKDAQLLTIGGGANEVHRNKIASGLLETTQ